MIYDCDHLCHDDIEAILSSDVPARWHSVVITYTLRISQLGFRNNNCVNIAVGWNVSTAWFIIVITYVIMILRLYSAPMSQHNGTP
jgi:hypothetical protein